MFHNYKGEWTPRRYPVEESQLGFVRELTSPGGIHSDENTKVVFSYPLLAPSSRRSVRNFFKELLHELLLDPSAFLTACGRVPGPALILTKSPVLFFKRDILRQRNVEFGKKKKY